MFACFCVCVCVCMSMWAGSVWIVFLLLLPCRLEYPLQSPHRHQWSAFRRVLTRAAMTTAEWRMPLGRALLLKESLYCVALLLRPAELSQAFPYQMQGKVCLYSPGEAHVPWPRGYSRTDRTPRTLGARQKEK